MTTPSRNDNEHPPVPPASDSPADIPVADASQQDTQASAWQETPATHRFVRDAVSDERLLEDLSDEEQNQANAALGFLGDVRAAVQESQAIPQSIGRYTIVRSLGRGGFAEVFLARDEELDRSVALKVPLFHAGMNEDGRLRFEREARVAASLGHPQIVPVYEFGDVGPVQFIAFAWCEGPTLAEWIECSGTIDFRTAALIVAHLAEAAQHAHQRGIVHRDLKPGNILIDEDASVADQPVWEQVRIADFGLARQLNVQDTTLTRDGQIIGTPAYMAPEQASGDFDAGPAADVWALGMILFELLTGKTPFRRPDLLTTIRAICDESVPAAKTFRQDVPAELAAIADLCLRKTPDDRYQSAHDLAVDLRSWLNGEPVVARPVSAVTKLSLWTHRNPLLATLIGLTIASLSIGLGVSMWQRNAAIESLQAAEAQAARADGNLDLAQTLIGDIISLENGLAMQSELAEERAALIMRTAKLQTKLIEDEQQTPRIRFDTAMTLRNLSRLLMQLGKVEESTETASRVLSLLDGLEKELPEGVTHEEIFKARFEQRFSMGGALSSMGKLDEAQRMFRANEAEVVPEGISPLQAAATLSESLRAQSMLLQMQGDRAGSAVVLQKALQHFEKFEVPEKRGNRWIYFLSRCRLLNALINDQIELGDLTKAEQNFDKAKQCLPEMKAIFASHPVLVDASSLLAFTGGTLYDRLQKPASAVEQYSTCRELNLSLFEQNPAATNPANIYVLASLALAKAHAANQSPEKAIAVAKESINRCDDFPQSLKSTDAFQDNISLLKALE